MALSIGSLGANTGITTTRPMNYTVENNSEVSSSYAEAMQNVDAAGALSDIDVVSPVGYANAQKQTVDPTMKMQQSQDVNAKFNAVASQFAGTVTGYGSDSNSFGYALIGSNLDLLA